MTRRFCTGAPNFNRDTQTCCERHDADYQSGYVTREQADAALLICVTAHGMPWRAIAMFVAVRLFGWLFFKKGSHK